MIRFRVFFFFLPSFFSSVAKISLEQIYTLYSYMCQHRTYDTRHKYWGNCYKRTWYVWCVVHRTATVQSSGRITGGLGLLLLSTKNVSGRVCWAAMLSGQTTVLLYYICDTRRCQWCSSASDPAVVLKRLTLFIFEGSTACTNMWLFFSYWTSSLVCLTISAQLGARGKCVAIVDRVGISYRRAQGCQGHTLCTATYSSRPGIYVLVRVKGALLSSCMAWCYIWPIIRFYEVPLFLPRGVFFFADQRRLVGCVCQTKLSCCLWCWQCVELCKVVGPSCLLMTASAAARLQKQINLQVGRLTHAFLVGLFYGLF